MALDVTVSGSDSDSYATLAEADAYALNMGVAAWLLTTVTDAEKESALRRAVQALDGIYRKRFPGVRTEGSAQALQWPRYNAYDCEGDVIDASTIPKSIKDSQIEMAFRELASPGSLAPDVVLSQSKILTKVGPVEWDPLVKNVSAASSVPTLNKVDQLLGCILRATGGFLVRA